MGYSNKQSHILNTAEKLFSENGFEGTSVRDIAEAADVNVAMISYYFGSKEKLMETLFTDRTCHFLPKIEKLIKNDKLTPVEKINVLIEDYVDKSIEKFQFFRILINAQLMGNNAVIGSLILDLRKKNSELLEVLIGEGQKSGVFKKRIDIPLLLNTLIGTVTQSFIHLDFYKNYYNLNHLCREELISLLKKKLNDFLKTVFKSILCYESQA